MTNTRRQQNRPTILVIDDDETVLEAVTDILALENIAVLSAASGEAGITLYEARQQELQLVLLDLSMPGMSGEETLQALQHLNPDVSVILTSGYDEKGAIDHLADRIVDFLAKPYHFDELVAIVKRHLVS